MSEDCIVRELGPAYDDIYVLDGRLITVEDKYVRSTRFVSVSTESGQVSLPPLSEVVLDDFGGTTDSVCSTIVGGKPSFIPVHSGAGLVVSVVSFDSSGNYTLSATPSAWPVAIIYRVRQKLKDFDSTSSDILGIATINAEGGSGGTTNHAELTNLDYANANHTGFVPDTIEVNGQPLSADVTIDAASVGLGNVPNVDATNPANITQDATHRFVSDTEKTTWGGKQDALGFTPENVANKKVTLASPNDTTYPTTQAVSTALENIPTIGALVKTGGIFSGFDCDLNVIPNGTPVVFTGGSYVTPSGILVNIATGDPQLTIDASGFGPEHRQPIWCDPSGLIQAAVQPDDSICLCNIGDFGQYYVIQFVEPKGYFRTDFITNFPPVGVSERGTRPPMCGVFFFKDLGFATRLGIDVETNFGTTPDYWLSGNVGYGSLAFGQRTKAKGNYSVCICPDSSASGENSIAIGNTAVSEESNCISIGSGAEAWGQNSVSFGNSAKSYGKESVTLGNNRNEGNRSGSVAVDSSVDTSNSTIIGSLILRSKQSAPAKTISDFYTNWSLLDSDYNIQAWVGTNTINDTNLDYKHFRIGDAISLLSWPDDGFGVNEPSFFKSVITDLGDGYFTIADTFPTVSEVGNYIYIRVFPIPFVFRVGPNYEDDTASPQLQRYRKPTLSWDQFSGEWKRGNSVDLISADTTLDLTQETVLVSGTTSITLPSEDFTGSLRGRKYTIKKTDSSATSVTIVGTIDGSSNLILSKQNDSVQLVNIGSNSWVISLDSRASSGSGYSTSAEVDFTQVGLAESDLATTTVSATWASSSLNYSVSIQNDGVDHDSEDVALERIVGYVTNIVEGVSFDIIASSQAGTWGRYKACVIAA